MVQADIKSQAAEHWRIKGITLQLVLSAVGMVTCYVALTYIHCSGIEAVQFSASFVVLLFVCL